MLLENENFNLVEKYEDVKKLDVASRLTFMDTKAVSAMKETKKKQNKNANHRK
jgi:hypothetical protein